MKLPGPSKRMLSADEAASYCGFPSVQKFRAVARVRPVNYGNCVRYDRVRLDEWLDTLTLAPAFDEDAFVEAAGQDEGARGRH